MDVFGLRKIWGYFGESVNLPHSDDCKSVQMFKYIQFNCTTNPQTLRREGTYPTAGCYRLIDLVVIVFFKSYIVL